MYKYLGSSIEMGIESFAETLLLKLIILDEAISVETNKVLI